MVDPGFQPAFPPSVTSWPTIDLLGKPGVNIHAIPGAVTLLDYFAAAALTALLDIEDIETPFHDQPDAAAEWCWKFAEAMIRTRPTPPEASASRNGPRLLA